MSEFSELHRAVDDLRDLVMTSERLRTAEMAALRVKVDDIGTTTKRLQENALTQEQWAVLGELVRLAPQIKSSAEYDKAWTMIRNRWQGAVLTMAALTAAGVALWDQIKAGLKAALRALGG